MTKYIVKQIEIDAFQYDGDLMNSDGEYYVPEWAIEAHKAGVLKFKDDGSLFIDQDSWPSFVPVNEYIIKNKEGKIYSYSEKVFLENCEPKDIQLKASN